jgi:hypothetical protein
MLEILKDRIDELRASRITRRSRHGAAVIHISPNLYEYWQRTAHLEFPGIPKDKVFYASALAGLLDFFACVRDSNKPCGLPSAAADSVWHAWAARAPGNLERFCVQYFGRPIPHIEEADMRPQMEAALATCMVQARRLERRDPVAPSVPSLFSLDRQLRMPRGYSYELKNGSVVTQRLDSHGTPHGGQRYLGGLECVQLLAAGLISQQVYDHHMRYQPGTSSGGACGSSSSYSTSSDSSAASCDSSSGGDGGCDGGGGGGDGGGGCGGGCGGS